MPVQGEDCKTPASAANTPTDPRLPSISDATRRSGICAASVLPALRQSTPGQRVVLMPVCESESLIVTDDYGDLFVRGNVERLRLPIARNTTLMSALSARDYDHYDVVALREGANESVILYVRQRHMR